MSRVFVSYRHVSPDQDLAVFLTSYLESRGASVFIDTQILTGVEWVKEIERQIRAADFFVVLLSKDSIRSHMVRQEVELAHELAQTPGSRFTILPIRVAYQGALPYDLGAYLNPIQHALWKEGDAYELIADQIARAIESHIALPQPGRSNEEEASPAGIQDLANATEGAGAPLPAADPRFMLETGAVKFASPFYVRRKADSQFETQVQSHGTTTIVKGPRQMGKSSLLTRADVAAQHQRQPAFYLDFQFIDTPQLASLESLLRYLARRFARFFKTTIKPDPFWDEGLGAKDNLTDFIEEALLSGATSPILFLFDEADRIFNQPYRDDFFATVRGWHNLRARKECWNHLNLVIAHSTEPHLWIQDPNQSPFNVGFHIRLDDFDLSHVSELNAKHGHPLKTTAEVQALLDLVGGQPYLVRQSLYTLVTNRWSIPELKREATSDTGPFGDHLRRFLWSLQNNQKLKKALRQALDGGQCSDEVHFQRLSAAGLLKGDTRDSVQMRCQLYRDYFGKHL